MLVIAGLVAVALAPVIVLIVNPVIAEIIDRLTPNEPSLAEEDSNNDRGVTSCADARARRRRGESLVTRLNEEISRLRDSIKRNTDLAIAAGSSAAALTISATALVFVPGGQASAAILYAAAAAASAAATSLAKQARDDTKRLREAASELAEAEAALDVLQEAERTACGDDR